jgi:hypothetical protein
LRIVAIDPGPVLGICMVHDGEIQVSHVRKTLGSLYNWLSLESPELVIVERFMFYKGNNERSYIDYSPAEVVGVVRAFAEREHVRCIVQNAAQAVGKTAFWGDSKIGNDRIRKIGLWDRQFYPHGMDALRHYLYWLTFTEGNNLWLMKLK